MQPYIFAILFLAAGLAMMFGCKYMGWQIIENQNMLWGFGFGRMAVLYSQILCFFFGLLLSLFGFLILIDVIDFILR